VVETLRAPRLFAGPEGARRIRADLPPALDALLDDPRRGLILATGHLGNWEIAGRVLAARKPVVGIARPMSNPYVEALVQRRAPAGAIRMIPRHDADAARFPRVLAEGGVLAFMIDQHGGRRGMAVDFFGRPAYLTVSGQLEAEAYACALGRVYTFGPTFRAENSNTRRHLAEFWMVEPEMAFADLEDDAALAEDYLRFLWRAVLEESAEDLAFFDRRVENGLLARLTSLADARFERLSYTEAIRALEGAPQPFEFPVSWGCDLQSEHERYLTEHAGGPVIVTDYPEAIKAFYMRLSADGRTVAAMDVLVPGVGELIGGSQREERLDVLERRMRAKGIDPAAYEWFLDLRRFGAVPHAGFGLGFERLVQFCTGMTNIRDVIPFPRTPGNAEG